MKPQPVTDAQMAFPGSVSHLMPNYSSIPDEFKRSGNAWVVFVDRWFFQGVKASDLITREGIDHKTAIRHLKTIMGSFEPKHEHKTAAVAWLLSQWFVLAEEAVRA